VVASVATDEGAAGDFRVTRAANGEAHGEEARMSEAQPRPDREPPDASKAPPTNEPLLVRLGVGYFQSLARVGTGGGPASDAAAAETATDAIHFLNADERRALRRVERGAIARAALAGAISSVIAAATEVAIAQPLLGRRPRFATWEDQGRFYAVVALATVVTSILEILFLYWDGLRTVHRLSREAGLDLFPNEDDDKALAGAMARAALELPNPTAMLFGVNPHREASRLRLVVASLVYKAKISVTNFLMKALVRRMLGRAFVRGWLPFVAVPITAAWNGFICWLIMREARIRAMGPSAAKEMVELVFASGITLSPIARTATLRAIASSIVRTEDVHPNLAALFYEVARRVDRLPRERGRPIVTDDAGDLDDPRVFLERVARLAPDEQRIVLQILAIASIIDGRLTRAEKRLLDEARTACALPPERLSIPAIDGLRRAFVDGDLIDSVRISRI
jgi:hypothetical protein